MSLIDDRGRLFGRVNLIDAIVVAVVLGVIPLAYGAFLMFRVPVPKVISITPAQIVEHEDATLQITGEDFRPFLDARFGTAASKAFFVLSPTHAEIRLPGLPAGTYDLTIADEGRVLVRKPGALTVVAPPARLEVATVRVRFVAGPEVLEVMKVGDVDVVGSGVVAEADRAVLTQIGSEPQPVTATTVTEGFLRRSFQLEQRVLLFTGTVRVPVVYKPSGWSYKDQPVKVGAAFTFETVSGAMMGWILDVKLDQER